MLIHNRIESSTANGPGNRAVIWTQGCSLSCPGCWNPETHAFDRNKKTSPSVLVDWVLGIPDIEGVTLSGGEPFEQTAALWLFCSFIKKWRPDFSIGAYTGYTLEELQAGRIARRAMGDGRPYPWNSPGLVNRILETMDFIVAGRFNQRLKCDDKPLCGSRNQQVHFLTNRYSEKDLIPNVVEMLLDPGTGLIQITGFPPDADALAVE